MAGMKKLLWTLPILPLVLAGCSTGSADSADSTNAAGSDSLKVVTSTQVWADVAEAVAPDVDIEAIITGGDIDPHSFEPSATDMAKVSEADIIIVGGGGYDSWLYGTLEDDDRIIHALDLSEHDHSEHETEEAHDHDEEGHDHDVDNEHVWYSTEYVSEVAEEFAEKATELDPEAQADATAVTTKMDELHNQIHDLPAVRIAQTEPIADHILSHSDMVESTPEGYRATTLSESEPTAADVASFQDAINNGDIDVLIYNPQSASTVATSLKDLAEEKGILVVEIYETPQNTENFLDVFTKAVDDLTAAANQV
ncbi:MULTISPECIES: metal ABC transporter solute-binding protein [Corynebacterium]|nr:MULTISPECIES: metal ABC transporter solute-binding protein [Corynebacterium]AST21663.1 ABC transporter substrate-binding protein [Corynebacterium glutamicum ATCC 14067]KEI24193.1 ABC transporter substrate-binding protein [Corynebacterium glutamicum ATCC 14067]QJS17740.1 zinc ABC transporter solute-binding protein [Corynebacterium glutamicum]QXU47338.1 metal ABC transporter solute-binding protein [[Brevibacterium] flavum]